MRKLKYYIASTIDGFIAHEDGSFDGLLMTGDHVSDYLAALQQFDVVLMGRKTYEVGVKEGLTTPYPKMKQFLISHTLQKSPNAAVTLVTEGLAGLVQTGACHLCRCINFGIKNLMSESKAIKDFWNKYKY